MASGATTGSFSAAAGTVAANQAVTITAALNGSLKTVSLTVLPLSSGLVAAYAFNEGGGTTTSDASGNGNTGQVSGASWLAAGRYGKALNFNGTSSKVTIADSASLHLSSAMTLEAWIQPSVIDNTWRDVIYKGWNVYFLEVNSDQGSLPIRPAENLSVGGNNSTYGPAPLAAGQWAHLAVTYNGAQIVLYVNGVAISTKAQTGNIVASNNPLQIGGDYDFGQYFNGIIDEVRVYNRALTAAEIRADMATPVTTTTVTTTSLTSLGRTTQAAVSPVPVANATQAAANFTGGVSLLGCLPRTAKAGQQVRCSWLSSEARQGWKSGWPAPVTR